MTASLKVVHRTTGRTRLRATALRGNRALARNVEQRLATVPGVIAARADHRTGSLVVHHRPLTPTLVRGFVNALPEALLPPGVSRERLLRLLLDAVDRVEDTTPRGLHQALDGALDHAEAGLRRVTHARVGLDALIPLAFLALAVRALLRPGRSRITWVTYVWFAIGMLQAIHAELHKAAAAPGRARPRRAGRTAALEGETG
jgi:hypothetical protein